MSFSSPHFNLLMIAWTLMSLLSDGLLIASSILLLRERHPSAWMMLAGSSISVVALGASYILPIVLSSSGKSSSAFKSIYSISALSSLGHLIFCIGLLLFVLHRRGLAKRVAELESILASRDKP